MESGRNNTGFYSMAFDMAAFGVKMKDLTEEIPTENALRYPGIVFVLSKQPPPSTEGISV